MSRDPLAPPVDPDGDTPPRAPRRRRPRMGQVVEALGRKATPSVTAGSVLADVERRERAMKARELLDGGKNRGEQKGYGAAKPSP